MEPVSDELRCLIAAGGTAGHVLPALAIADALRQRGVTVTFAGTAGRFEARLVPEAGYELDTFRVSGLPRRPGVALLRGLAPVACRRILARRRPHVVLGAGGYVAGPMVLAAATRRLPAALTEADSHLGLANRLAAPAARRVFLSFPVAGRGAPKYVATQKITPRITTASRTRRSSSIMRGIVPAAPDGLGAVESVERVDRALVVRDARLDHHRRDPGDPARVVF